VQEFRRYIANAPGFEAKYVLRLESAQLARAGG
jgi:hypothetical protein